MGKLCDWEMIAHVLTRTIGSAGGSDDPDEVSDDHPGSPQRGEVQQTQPFHPVLHQHAGKFVMILSTPLSMVMKLASHDSLYYCHLRVLLL